MAAIRTRRVSSTHFNWSSALSRRKSAGAVLVAACSLVAATRARGAQTNFTWSGTPTDANWGTAANWAPSTPGTLNWTGNATSGAVAFFITPIPSSGIGGASNPIAIWTSTTGGNSALVGGITFDGNAGAYTIGANSTDVLYVTAQPTSSPPGTGATFNAITMTANVTNPEVFNAPVHVRLPSSQNGAFFITNNAPSPSATMSFNNGIISDAANTRANVFVLGGSNTGNNTISFFDDILVNNSASAIVLKKQDAGTWILTGAAGPDFINVARTLTAGAYVDGGTLALQNGAALGTVTGNNIVAQGGTLRLDAIALQNNGISLAGSGVLLSNGSSSVNNVQFPAATFTGPASGEVVTAAGSVTFQTVNATDVLTVNGAVGSGTTFNGAASTVLHVTGPGQVSLNAAGSFAGTWSFDSGLTRMNNSGSALGGNGVGLSFGAGSTGLLQLNGQSPTVGAINSNATTLGTPAIENGGGGTSTLTVSGATSSSYAGKLRDGTGGGNLAVTKAGVGTFTLAGNNSYTGNTSINGGTLIVANASGSATGSGNITAAANTTFAGTGSVAGNVTINANSFISPGIGGVGTLTVGSLNLATGSMLNYDITSTSVLDQINVTQQDGLSIDGGTFNVNGGNVPFTTNGVYNLIGFTGNIGGAGGVAALKLNAGNQATTNTYAFGTGSGFVTLTVSASGAVPTFWNADADGNWSTGPWTAGTPNATGAFAGFGGSGTAITAPRTITVDGAFTVGTLSFNNASFSYSLSGGTLNLDNNGAAAFITDSAGSHMITSGISLISSSGVLVTVINAADTMTLAGSISAAGATITKKGNGTLALTGNNTYSGGTQIDAGVIQINSPTSLGDPSGALTFNGGGIQLLADVTTARNYQLNAVGDAIIDTNGHAMTNSGNITPLPSAIGGLTKNGNGSLILQGTNTYTGPTTVNGGSLSISSNANIGDPATAATLNLSNNTTLFATATMSLNNGAVGTNDRNVTIGASGATIDVAPTTTLTISGVLSGGTVNLPDTGTLAVTNTGNTTPFVVTGGILLAAGNTANTNGGVGSGAITLQGGAALNASMGANNTLGLANAIIVPAGQSATINMTNRYALQGPITGAGNLTVNVNTTVTRDDFSNNFAGYTGNLTIAGSGGLRLLVNGGGFNSGGLSAATVDLEGTVNLNPSDNSGGNTYTFGSLMSTSTAAALGAPTQGGTANYVINGLNTSTTFAGQVLGNTRITKAGTGTFTLTNTASNNTGGTVVNGGLVDATAGAVLGTGPVTVSATGTSGTVADAATLNSNNSINTGNVTVTSNTAVATAIATLNESGANLNWGALSGNGIINFTSTAGPISLNLAANTDAGATPPVNNDATFSGVITDGPTGALSITKNGSNIQTLSGNNTYSGVTQENIGILQLGSPTALGNSSLFLGGGKVATTAGFTHAIRLSSLTVFGGVLDLNDNDMIMPYTAGSSPISQIQSLLASGYAGGAWNGGFGIVSSAAAADASKLTALGYGDAKDLGITSDDNTPIGGDGNAVIVKYTYYGDSNLDGKVDLGNDFNLFLIGYLTPNSTGWELGDYNYDGFVDAADFGLLVDSLKLQGTSLGQLDDVISASPLLSSAQKASLLAAVPEPSSLALAGLAACGLATRRRRNK